MAKSHIQQGKSKIIKFDNYIVEIGKKFLEEAPIGLRSEYDLLARMLVEHNSDNLIMTQRQKDAMNILCNNGCDEDGSVPEVDIQFLSTRELKNGKTTLLYKITKNVNAKDILNQFK